VTPFELAEDDVIAHRFQAGHHDPAALIDRQDLIRSAVGEEQARTSMSRSLDDEPGRAGDDLRKQIAVGESEREAVRRTVGEAADGNACGIDLHTIEDRVERAIDERDVLTEIPADRVPGSRTGIWSQHRHAHLIRGWSDALQHAGSILCGAVEEEQQRESALGWRRGWNLDDAVALTGAEPKRTALQGIGRCPAGTGGEPPVAKLARLTGFDAGVAKSKRCERAAGDERKVPAGDGFHMKRWRQHTSRVLTTWLAISDFLCPTARYCSQRRST